VGENMDEGQWRFGLFDSLQAGALSPGLVIVGDCVLLCSLFSFVLFSCRGAVGGVGHGETGSIGPAMGDLNKFGVL
jgi:hypothetical protein